MHKLKLRLDDLSVDSYVTSDESGRRGTAHAPEDTLAPGDTLAAPPAEPQGEGGPVSDLPGYGFHTASCTNCDTCQTACP